MGNKKEINKQYSDVKTVFLISSPLQALACWLILKDNDLINNPNIMVFTEGHYSLPNNSNLRQIKLKNTRKNKKHIKHNVKLIL